jgi:hypothetical protein
MQRVREASILQKRSFSLRQMILFPPSRRLVFNLHYKYTFIGLLLSIEQRWRSRGHKSISRH